MRPAIIAAALVLTASASISSGQVPPGPIERAVGFGLTTYRVKVDGRHDFNIEPPRIRQSFEGGQSVTLVEGRLSHRLRYRRDDQYHYSFTVTAEGTMTRLTEQITRATFGGLQDRVERAIRVTGQIPVSGRTYVQVLADLARSAGAGFGSGLSWEVAARKIVSAIAVRVVNGRPR